MIYKLTDILRDVRVALDQNAASGRLLLSEDEDTLSLDEIIMSKVVESVRRVHCAAPSYLLECGHNFGDAVYWRELESGYVLLPDDFMRLVVFRMSDWERAVYTALSTGDAAYGLLSSRYKGLRGTPQRPVCAVVVRPEGRALEFYSCKSRDAEVCEASYVPFPRIDCGDGIDISERCYEAVVYTAASLTLTTYGDSERAGAMQSLAESVMI